MRGLISEEMCILHVLQACSQFYTSGFYCMQCCCHGPSVCCMLSKPAVCDEQVNMPSLSDLCFWLRFHSNSIKIVLLFCPFCSWEQTLRDPGWTDLTSKWHGKMRIRSEAKISVITRTPSGFINLSNISVVCVELLLVFISTS